MACRPPHGPRDRDRAAPLSPLSPAYVVYTSGSTGTPKAVVATHALLTSLFHGHRRDLYAPALRTTGGRKLRAASVASVAFDTFWEPVLLLLDGHEIHLLDEPTRRDPEAVAGYAGRHGIDFLNLTPAFFAQMRAARAAAGTVPG